MKSDKMWDLGTEGGQQQLLVPTAGVTAAYAEQAHKVTLNASSDIFARCSKFQATDKSRVSASTISMLWLIQTTRLRCKTSVRFSSRCLLSLLGRSSLGKEIWFPSRVRRVSCSKHFYSQDNNSSATIIPVLFQQPRNALIELTFKLP